MENNSSFGLDAILAKFRFPFLLLLSGLIVIACGIIYFRRDVFDPSTKVEVLNATTSSQFASGEITVEIAGEVMKPGVYKLASGSRVDDLLTISGGLTLNADRTWTDKYLNRAAKLTDSQKFYIPKIGDQSTSTSKQTLGVSAKTSVGDQTVSPQNSHTNGVLVNINTGSLKELDSIAGIGPTYAQNIIEHRPYSTLEELVSKGAIKQNLFEKIKDKITIY